MSILPLKYDNTYILTVLISTKIMLQVLCKANTHEHCAIQKCRVRLTFAKVY